jgi:hypothetical protein
LNPVLIVLKISLGTALHEGPRLREVRRADWTVQLVRQGWRRRAVGATERAVTFDAAVVHVEFLPASTVAFVIVGALGSSTGFGTLSLFEKSAEKVVMK